MAAIGLIMHLGRDEASAHARDLAVWLLNEGHSVRVPPDDAEVSGMADHMVEPANFADGLDVCVTLGGDGSILRAVELLGTAVVPILGVDHGQLGYLTEVEPSGAQTAVARVLQGDFEVDERMLVSVLIRSDGGEERHFALNEAVVERAADANTIRLAVDLDDEFFTTYAADGLIVATPTGSTAYAFSARGPIIDPTHSALLLTPVSPHMLFDRSLVLAPSTRVRLTIDGHRPATVSVDGRRVAIVGDGDTIECSAADHSAQMVSLGPRRFHRVLKAKFGLNDR
jgi:NAD+ kinase